LTPHDTLFRFTFCHASHAASWLAGAVPMDLAAAIDWSTLVTADERLLGHRLQTHIADQVFVAATRATAAPRRPLLLLVEHKSHADAGLDAQLLRYAVLLRRTFQTRREALPLLLTVVLRHGTAARGATADDGPFAPFQPQLHYVVDDLTLGERALDGRTGLTPLAELTLRCLAALPRASPHEVLACLERWQELLRAVDRTDGPPGAPPLGPDAIDTIGWYALAVTEVPAELLSESLAHILQRPEHTIMSTLERTYQSGLAAGRAEGKAEGKADGLLRLLQLRFGDVVDAAVVARVRGASIADLDHWTDRILDAATLAAVFID